MYMRLGFAIAVTVDPDILLIDEVLAVGDEAFQHRCIGKIQEFKARGKTIVLVSHDLGSIERLCDEAVWLDGGRLRASGETREVIGQYLDHVAREEARALGIEHAEAEAAVRGGTAARWGTREVELTRVQLRDKDGIERYLFETGEPCTLRLAYRVHRPIEDPVFGIRRCVVMCSTRRVLLGLRHLDEARRSPPPGPTAFDTTTTSCATGKVVFHPECISDAPRTQDGLVFDTFANQLAKNGDRGKRVALKIDVEGAEWDSFLHASDEALDHIDQIAVEFHHVHEMKHLLVVARLKRLFHVAHIHFNNFNCDPRSHVPRLGL